MKTRMVLNNHERLSYMAPYCAKVKIATGRAVLDVSGEHGIKDIEEEDMEW